MNHLEKKYSVTSFIDILGYKELILNEADGKEAEFFSDLQESIEVSLRFTADSIKRNLDIISELTGNSEKPSEKLNVKQFSDNIYFSFDYDKDDIMDLAFGSYIIISTASFYQRLMLGKGYFVRGGIAHGFNMVDKNFIFSNALIRAVEIEKETIYPRITIHKDLAAILIKYNNNPFSFLMKDFLIEDWTKQIFVNPFINVEEKTIEELKLLPVEILEPWISKIASDQNELSTKINNKYSYFTNTPKFNALVRKIILERLNKFQGKQQNVFEKYLWALHFLNWTEGKKTKLYFKTMNFN